MPYDFTDAKSTLFQAMIITRANVDPDLWRHIASLCRNKLRVFTFLAMTSISLKVNLLHNWPIRNNIPVK